jgi:hypothetical protein
MGERINLESRATDAISEALHGMTTYDADALRDALEDRAGEEADNACIYYHHCHDIISDYERDYGDAAEDMGGTFTAGQWQEAMVAYAYGIAYAALSSFIADSLKEIEEAADELGDVFLDEYPDAPNIQMQIGRDCPHGWAPHDHEDADGTHHWYPRELEGCHAIAREVSGVWLSYTWTPEPAAEQEPVTASPAA